MESDTGEGKTEFYLMLAKGTLVGHYRIIEKIGSGGMGEVYRAEDTNLSRQVAIKVLPDLFGSDPERLARFEREAKLLASLNHPNLSTVYGFESVEGKRFLVMELVEGETLSERITKGPLPLDDALDVFQQIAAGMEAAHEKGIIHRDLKPANIKITPEGKVKILDFGLAKALHGEIAASDLADSPTITANMTRAGVILGTAAYMSPEQARGRPVDKRTDIWAFGCIVFECLTGKRAFGGETTSETLAAILRGEPDWNQLPQEIPPHIRSLLNRCLQKDPSRRLRDIGDASFEADGLLDRAAGTSLRRSRSWREWIAWGIAILSVGIMVVFWIMNGRPQHTKSAPIITSILPPANSVNCFIDGFALSPDGRKLAFVSLSSKGERLLWVRSLDRQDAITLAGTEDASYPFWSPDGTQIAFYAGGKLKRISSTGGPILAICTAHPIGYALGSWGSAGVIIFGDASGGLSQVPEGGGEPKSLRLREPFSPFFLPNGRDYFYLSWKDTELLAYLASLDKSGPGTEITGVSDANRIEWVAPNRLVLHINSNNTVVTQRLDQSLTSTLGPRELLADGISSPADVPPFSTSPANLLAFVSDSKVSGNDSLGGNWSRAIWVDRKGAELGQLGERTNYWNVRISSDGRRVVCNIADDAWIINIASGIPTRVTSEAISGGYAYRPIWSPRGDLVLARGVKDGKNVLLAYSFRGREPREIYSDSSASMNATDWSSDGRYLAIAFNNRQNTLYDLEYVDVANGQAKIFLATPANEFGPQFSPDVRWIAYMSNETGSYEVYIRSFPNGEETRRISYAGGMHPRWRADGKELFFLAPGGTMMAVDTKLQPTLEIGKPHELFQMLISDIVKGTVSPYDVTADGQRFLIIQPHAKPIPLTLVQNWQALVDR
jgi:eukaryotic-like serine/threonine-protein kinase